ncbi:MAG: VCBS repeat-containing protein, partial [Planctomycetaceae bacterium]
VLTQLDRPAQAAPFLDRSRKINRYTTAIATANATQRTSDMKLVVSLAEELGLVWEAFGWSQWVTQQDTTQQWAHQALRRLGPRLEALEPARTLASANPVATIDLGDLPLPDWSAKIANNSRLPRELPGVRVRFEDQARTAGIAFRYFCGGNPDLSGPRYMYQMTGGGAAAIDFDLDGWPDLFLPQGGEFSDRNRQSAHLDRLLRNTGDGRFEDVTIQAGLSSNGFGQGQAVGDINGDGFPDLLVANIGGNRLYHNNGDGTYTDISGPAGISGDRWTTSCLLADLNNDGLPDLYAANFLSGKDVFTQECNRIRSPVSTEPLQKDAGETPPAMRSGNCSPLDFPSAQDQLYLNLGDGRFREITTESGIRVPRGNGLGIVAADFSGNGRLNLFLANDSVPNFFFVHQGQDADGIPRFRERALPLGLAVNQDGRSEACMGVASGDADGDGRIDLYVTNFLNQSNTLYRKLAEQEFFADVTQRAGLFESSVGLLGWGTQFVDANLDGQIDLIVTNGHVGQFPEQDTLFQMPTQYLHNTGQGRFVELPAKRLGSFFSQHALGRGMARLDWNRDGLDDVAISHIDAPLALLTCTSPTHG